MFYLNKAERKIGVLNRLERKDLKPQIWQGTASAVVVSILAGLRLNLMGMRFEGRGEEIFEGLATLFAGGVLTWMILWMQPQGQNIKEKIETDTSQAINLGKRALFILA
jgi:FTR1 family protein